MAISQSPARVAPVTSETEVAELLLSEVAQLANRLRQSIALPDSSSIGFAENEVLQILQQHGPMSVPNIARERNTTRQNIQVVVNRLRREGLVQLRENPAHKRSFLVELTASALSLSAQAKGTQREALEQLMSQFTVSELQSVTDALTRIRELLERQQSATMKAEPRSKIGAQIVQPDKAGAATPIPSALPHEEIPISLL